MAPPHTTPEISVLVPVKDEEENIQPQIEEIRDALGPLDRPYEIIYIDDGSTDRTWEVLRKLQREAPELRLIRLDRNHGQSAATDAGIRRARGGILVTLDGDRQNVPADIPRLLEAIEGADMVCGYRANRRDTLWRRLQSRFANAVRNRLTGDSIRDTGCSLKAFRKACFENVRFFQGMHRFMPTLARMEGFRVVEIPVSHRPRNRGATKYGMWNRAWSSWRDLMAVRWMRRRRLTYAIKEDIPPGDAPSSDSAAG